MALYYWLGQTGNGNVNLAANWSLWGPTASSQSLPPSSPTIPKYNDSIKFSKYTIGSTGLYYPIFGPSGQLNGLCGPVGNTTGQWLNTVTVDDDCPVPLGSAEFYFKFCAGLVQLNTGTNPAVGFGPQAPSYIDLVAGTGVTKPDATVTGYAKRVYEYNIKGVASKFLILNNTSVPSRGIYYFNDIDFTGVGTISTPWAITDASSVGKNSYDVIYLNSTTTHTLGNLHLVGKGTVCHIGKGYNTSDSQIYLSAFHANAEEGPTVYFDAEGASGASGPTNTTRSYVSKLTLESSRINTPRVFIAHGTDIVHLNQLGGTINFNQTPTTDTTNVQRGAFDASVSKIRSLHGTVNLGTNGTFHVINDPYFDTAPNISLGYVSSYTLAPVEGYTGAQ
jgi:hypothetical protein